MFLTILPVSGGNFATQLTSMLHLCEIKFKSDVIFSSSGGNVAAYITLAANWDRSNIYKICNHLNCEMFLNKWCYSEFISFIIGFFRGFIYNKGTGIEKYVKKWFTEESIQETEIWTGTYNKKYQKPRLFTNISKGNSKFLDKDESKFELDQCMSIVYSSGDLELISKYIIASASIPSLVPEQYIEGDTYIDGGMFSASPLSLLSDALNEKNKHMIYITPINIYNSEENFYNNFLENVRQSTDYMVKSNIINDRMICYNLLKMKYNDIIEYEFVCNYINLKRIKKIWNLCENTLLEIYPEKDKCLPLNNFKNKDIIDIIEIQYNNMKCKFSIPLYEKTEKIDMYIYKCVNNIESKNLTVI